jgi:ferric-dicitrate binding protein FerR (iron transport regulator)
VAAGFLADRGYDNVSVTVTQNRVEVSAEDTVDTAILGLIGIGTFTVRGDAVAEPETGIG